MAALVLAVWTVVIWIGRVRNVVADDGPTLDLIVPLALLTLGVATLVRPRLLGRVLSAATAVVWLVRLPLLLLHGHSAAFVVVHVALAAASLGLATWALSASRDQRRVPA